MSSKQEGKPKPAAGAQSERLTKRVVRKPDGRYLILYEPKTHLDRDR